MSRRRNETSQQRRLRFEQFEKRLVMSAQAVASLLPELDIAAPALTQQVVSIDGPATTHAADIAAQYGFDGAGQTVAVIDSGIAWDHYALGGGYGAGNKVVGGWDFAENDANPYDDGPAGYHGSHVAGIIGSTDDQYRGVSSGVDLVSLRVFGDNGEGDLDWVEQALQWVHDHKDDFANPITTVNLSLGTNWNADTMPEWATLEGEFAQLEADGLFISVAAGNAFTRFGEAGLSYPAVSEYVVPVSSHDADGNISDFAQRTDGVLAAPGESIRSTVPDHLFGGTSGGRFLGSTGTSMAAPYVAGASAVLRQANEFMGVTDVTQDMLYEQFRETADQVYDAVTGGYFYRVNLDAALAAVVHDVHGGSTETATDAGVLGGGETIEGTIGRIADVDAFEFTAGQSGKMTLRFEVTDDLVPLVDVVGVDARINGHQISFDVVEGQKYNFAVATADGNGHYKISVESDGLSSSTGSNNPVIDWGSVISGEFLNQPVDGESTFELTAGRNGFLTVESSVATAGPLAIEVYDSQMNLLQSSSSKNGEVRLDVEAKSGEKFFVKAIGQSDAVDFRVTNLVSLEGGFLSVHGTNQDDNIAFSGKGDFSLNVNGVDYQFDKSLVNSVQVIGHNGNDSIDLALGADNDRVSTRTNGVSVRNQRFNFDAFGVQSVDVAGGGGYDRVSMRGSSENDTFSSGESSGRYTAELSGSGYLSQASGFEMFHVVATEGSDAAQLNGTEGDERFASKGERSWMKMDGSLVVVDGYDSISVNGGGGHDTANLYDSNGDDQFVLTSSESTVTTDSYRVSVTGMERVNAFSRNGTDSVTMHDTAGAETFNHRNGFSVLNGDGYTLLAKNFANVDVVSVGGNDIAQVFDTAGDDTFYGDAGKTKMVADELSVGTSGFKHVNLISNKGGYDRAVMRGTDGDDVVLVDSNSSRLTMSNGQSSRVVGVDETEIDTRGGLDLSFITGSGGQETLAASYSEVELETTLQLLRMTNVEHTVFDGNGGEDKVSFDEMGELDLLESIGDKATAYLKDHTVTAREFSILEARSVDNAIAQYDLEAVDYLYLLRGQWAQKQ